MTDTTAGEGAFGVLFYAQLREHAMTALREGKPFQINADGAIALIDQAKSDRLALAAQPSAGAQDEWPEAWSGPCTVGNMIANLKTLPPETPLYTAYHVTFGDARSLCRVKRPTLSWERVDDGTIKQGDASIPYSAIIWANPKQPEATPAQPDTGDVAALREATGGEAVIRGGKIVISIDVDALPMIVSGSCATYRLDGLWKVTDAEAFAKDVCISLNAESENGTTRVHKMFDGAFDHAIDQGAEGIDAITEPEFEVEASRLRLAALSKPNAPGAPADGGA